MARQVEGGQAAHVAQPLDRHRVVPHKRHDGICSQGPTSQELQRRISTGGAAQGDGQQEGPTMPVPTVRPAMVLMHKQATVRDHRLACEEQHCHV